MCSSSSSSSSRRRRRYTYLCACVGCSDVAEYGVGDASRQGDCRDPAAAAAAGG